MNAFELRRRRVSSRSEGEEERGDGTKERERQDRATSSETGHPVHSARRVYKLSNLVDKSVLGLFFVPSGCTPLPLLGVYTPLGSRERQLSKSRVRFIKPLWLPEF